MGRTANDFDRKGRTAFIVFLNAPVWILGSVFFGSVSLMKKLIARLPMEKPDNKAW